MWIFKSGSKKLSTHHLFSHYHSNIKKMSQTPSLHVSFMCAAMLLFCTYIIYDNMYGSLETILQYKHTFCLWVVCIICYLYISYHHFIDLSNSFLYTHAHVQLHVMICFIISETSTLLTNAIIRSWHHECPTVRIPVI